MNPSPSPSPWRTFRAAALAAPSVILLLAGIFAGCATEPSYPRREVIVERPYGPPPPPREVIVERDPHQVVIGETPPLPSRVIVVERNGRPPAPIVIDAGGPPPPPRHEMRPGRPSRAHVWVEGHWRYQGRQYVWVPGYWTVPPHPRAEYVPPHWERRREGQVFIEGYWRY